MHNYQFDAKLELVEKMINPIISSLEECGASNKTIYQVNLILEELLVNISKYAYAPNEGIIDISFELDKNLKRLRVILKDKGKPFNPLEKEDPNLDGNVQERAIGGLGIYIVKNMVDDIKYQRINNENILEFSKNI